MHGKAAPDLLWRISRRETRNTTKSFAQPKFWWLARKAVPEESRLHYRNPREILHDTVDQPNHTARSPSGFYIVNSAPRAGAALSGCP
jgi:hypothetical protein